LDIWGKKTFLHFLSRRFDCEQCGKPFTEELSFVETHRRQTIAFERHVYESCLSANKKKVAKSEGLSQSTARDIFNRWAKLKVRCPSVNQTRVLGIDEMSLKKRHKQFALIISDMDRKCILAVLPTRERDALENWIDSLSEQQRGNIRFVSTDMWAPYRQAVQRKLSHATLVVDRFHVMKQLNGRLTQLRSAIQHQSSKEVASILKGSRWILVRNRCDLTAKDEAHLQEILELCPELRTLYLLKEEFRCIFEKVDTREKAHRFLSAWKLKAQYTGNKYLSKFLTTLKNWWNEILNYFIDNTTNGFVEGLNGAIRNIIRIAFGYRNFVNFKLRLFAEYGFPTNPR
jgi:transposase